MQKLIFIIVFSTVGIGFCAGIGAQTSTSQLQFSPGIVGWIVIAILIMLAVNFVLSFLFPERKNTVRLLDSAMEDIPGLTVTQINKNTARVEAKGRIFIIAPDRDGKACVQEMNNIGQLIGPQVSMRRTGRKTGEEMADYIKRKVNTGK